MQVFSRRFSTTAIRGQAVRATKRKSSLGYRLTTVAAVGVVGAGGLYWYYRDARSSIHQYLVLPLVRLFCDGEKSHKLAIEVMQYPWLNPREPKGWDDANDPNRQLEVTLFANTDKPLKLRSPVGVAAGLDKDGKAVDSLLDMGFSYVEVGSITPQPQPGNPLPRFFRLEKDDAVINRYGFNSEGHFAVLGRLKTRLAKAMAYPLDSGENNALRPEKALAVNLGKNKTGDETEDYVAGVKTFGNFADVLVVNVSSPNTPGLRDLQSESKLTNLLERLVSERNQLNNRRPPLVVKIAPDLSEPEIESIAAAVKASKIDGVIVSNTTISRPAELKTHRSIVEQVGGLSGKPVKPLALKAVKSLRSHIGPEITIIGCGGISNGHDAIEFARAGADFVQTYTGFAYKGASTACDIKQEILKELDGKKWTELRQ